MPHRRVLIGLLLVAILLAAGYAALWWAFTPPASAINRANAAKIKPGMTLADIVAILGPPRGWLREVSFDTRVWRHYRDSQGDWYCSWHEASRELGNGIVKECYVWQ